MEAYRTDAVVEENRKVTIGDLPFQVGERVEVIVLQTAGRVNRTKPYPLRGEPLRYANPFDGVAEGDWEALS